MAHIPELHGRTTLEQGQVLSFHRRMTHLAEGSCMGLGNTALPKFLLKLDMRSQGKLNQIFPPVPRPFSASPLTKRALPQSKVETLQPVVRIVIHIKSWRAQWRHTEPKQPRQSTPSALEIMGRTHNSRVSGVLAAYQPTQKGSLSRQATCAGRQLPCLSCNYPQAPDLDGGIASPVSG